MNRLRAIRNALGYTQTMLADILGVGKAAVAMIETGKAQLSQRNRNILIQKLNVNPDYIDSGHGAMFNSEPRATFEPASAETVPFQRIPLYSSSDSPSLDELLASGITKPESECIYIPRLSKCDGAMYVTTDAMLPVLRSGDIVIYKRIQSTGDILWGEMYLLSAVIGGEQYTLLRYLRQADRNGYVRLSGSNPSYADRDIEASSITSLAMVKATIRIQSM